MFKWDKISESLQQDLKLFLFILGVMCLFRGAFIVIMHSYMSDVTTWSDIGLALYYGLRISLKSAGLLGLFSLILCALFSLLRIGTRIPWRFYAGSVYLLLLTILFYARIPYYEQFHMGFNQLLFNTFEDDAVALFHTMIQQYQLPQRFVLAMVTAWALIRLFRIWLRLPQFRLPKFSRWYEQIAFRACLLGLIYFLGIFIRFGGSLTYAHNIDWENSGVTKDPLLNEAILDDVQALYRAYELNERLNSSTGIDLDATKLNQYGTYVAGHSVESHNLDDYLKKKAQGAKIEKPKHIFLILSESYANWPLLPEYSNLQISQGLKGLIAQPDAAYVSTFLPNGMSTISGLTGVITGLTDVNLYVNYLPEAYRGPLPTAIAPQMKKLGYKPRFWYGGPSSWEKIKDFTLAQGFDEFYGSGDFKSEGGNVWGSDDKYLFQAVAEHMSEEDSTFNVILTVSNHAPFTVDLAKEGFDENKVRAALPEGLRNNQDLVKQLGHFWYADQKLAQFVTKMRSQYPDSLFLIMGDHADRLNLENNPGLYKRYGIPFVVYGQGIRKDIFPTSSAGSHINVAATLIELVAPRGFEYYALSNSLTRGQKMGINYGYWLSSNYMGPADRDSVKERIGNHEEAEDVSFAQVDQEIRSLRAISWWRIKKGPQF